MQLHTLLFLQVATDGVSDQINQQGKIQKSEKIASQKDITCLTCQKSVPNEATGWAKAQHLGDLVKARATIPSWAQHQGPVIPRSKHRGGCSLRDTNDQSRSRKVGKRSVQ